jgi:predicted  nucleic acid-binding Zn-ribbon protein
MSTLDAYKQKLEAELEVAQAKLVQLKADAKNATADAQIKLSEEADTLEQGVDAAKAKLAELADAGEDTWEQLKEGAESAWGKLSASLRNIADKF